ncbi:MAG: ATP-dependent DNA helicase [Myxococcota bacterium]|nr:hypothetical protein [Spirochaeta sp.]RPG14158.1 MAG: ATP-dependent DNA helicase [Proteobacteria bacterium TMED72]
MESSSPQGVWLKRLEAWESDPGYPRLRAFLDELCPVAIVTAGHRGSGGLETDSGLPRGAVLLDETGSGLHLLQGVSGGRLDSTPDPSDPFGEIERKATERAWLDSLAGRTVIMHGEGSDTGAPVRSELVFSEAGRVLDTRDLMMLTHPDMLDHKFESWYQAVWGSPPDPDATSFWVFSLLMGIANAASVGESRYEYAREALERFSGESPWLSLLPATAGLEERGRFTEQTVQIESTEEEPVPFDLDAIADVLADEARGARYFPGYRARPEQITLMRSFFENLEGGGSLLIEGGTGVGKSLAYLAAAIPFAMARAEAGEREPVVISTRTKLLQDQLLEKDIAAAARMLGHPELKALSIKGRANYVCERRLQDTLATGSDLDLLAEDRMTYSSLLSCARIRPGGEVGSLPSPFFRRRPLLRDLIEGSVARRAEQCSREQCGHERRCPFGQRRQALGKADLIVANHDLLLRWPPDYPRFEHVIVDEAHELASVADEVYAQVVRPEEIQERLDEIFGSPSRNTSNPGLLPHALREEALPRVTPIRRTLHEDLSALGRLVADESSAFGEFELPPDASRVLPRAAQMAELSAARLDELSRLAQEFDARAEWGSEESPANEGPSAVLRHAQSFSDAAVGLRRAFSESGLDAVAAFDRLVVPHDRWTLAIRAVSPASDFHEHFMEGLESFSGVSASLFVGGDAFAAVGELEIEERSHFGVDKVTTPSPFDYAGHMRVAAIRPSGAPLDLVSETTAVIADVARSLGGRTMGLFSSLKRMREVAERLETLLSPHQIEVLAPRRSGDDPGGLVRRFRDRSGGGVLLGSRTFWQGLDIAGDDLQAVVIEKLPFEVPTELRRRRETHLSDMGENAFQRYRLGKMLLNLKQMTGRLIRGESDRGLVVIVDARTQQRYFEQIGSAMPGGVEIQVVEREILPELLSELNLISTLTNGDSGS